MTANGVSGVPTRATAEKGERLLDAAAEALAALITDPETWAAPGDRRGQGTESIPGGVPFRNGA
jgi:creatinine amidohydrolase